VPRIHRPPMFAVAVALVVAFSPAQAQEPARSAFAAGHILSSHTEGTFLAPTLSRSFGGGAVQGRFATSLALNAMPSDMQYGCPSIRGYVCDTRELGMAASSTFAIEFGARQRAVTGGFFVAAHGGVAALRWRSGGRDDRTGPVDIYTDYRGRTSAALLTGVATGVDLPVGASPLRLQLGFDVLHERWQQRASVTVGVVRRW